MLEYFFVNLKTVIDCCFANSSIWFDMISQIKCDTTWARIALANMHQHWMRYNTTHITVWPQTATPEFDLIVLFEHDMRSFYHLLTAPSVRFSKLWNPHNFEQIFACICWNTPFISWCRIYSRICKLRLATWLKFCTNSIETMQCARTNTHTHIYPESAHSVIAIGKWDSTKCNFR